MIQFWAQSLDNKSPDLFADNGPANLVAENDQHRKRAIVARVARASCGGLVDQRDGVVAHLAGSEFVMKVPCVERDVVGRLAPFVGVGEVRSKSAEHFADDTAKAFQEFAAMVGRRLLPRTVEAIKALARTVFEKKKSRTRRLQVIMGVYVAILALLLAFMRKL